MKRLAEMLADVTGLTADSRQVRPGMLYAALPGARADGRAYIPQAVANGAAAVLAPEGTVWPEGTPERPLYQVPDPRSTLAHLAAERAGPFPPAIVAITGTNGKTSTADFLRQILTLAGQTAASIGTLGVIPPLPQEGGDAHPTLTTPDPIQLAETLAALARHGTEAVAIEASSHGLDQRRLDAIRPAAAAFTNLTRDHLDYHADFQAYRQAKLRLFTDLLPFGAPAFASTALDAAAMRALRDAAPALRTVGEGGTAVDLLGVTPHPSGQVLEVRAAGRQHTIDLPLLGRFQADNALMAAALAHAVGVQDALSLLPHLRGVRGRMELAATPNGAAAYVDYAHTPDALARLLAALRPHATGRLILVFGAGGDRDPGKRPLMGEAAMAADLAIITDDNPRTEDPAAIRAAIAAARPGAQQIGDRRQAIAAALALLQPGDILAVAGKGHEAGQTIGTTVHPFDDAEIIKELLAPVLAPGAPRPDRPAR